MKTSQQPANPNEPINSGRVQWLSDFVRAEILLWAKVDRRLKEEGVSLAFFEVLWTLERSNEHALRVGDIAAAIGITVGGASKLVDRVVAAGLIERYVDDGDKRASLLKLSAQGRQLLSAAVTAYDAEVAAILDPVLTKKEQATLHSSIRRILDAEKEA